jgi:hypothetical protein
VKLPIQERWEATWTKVIQDVFKYAVHCGQVQMGIDYVRRVHSGQFDWFMRIDDDAYVIFENLIMFLRTRQPTALEMYRTKCVRLYYLFVLTHLWFIHPML